MDVHPTDPAEDVWLHPDLRVGPSWIHGRGLVSAHAIPEGIVVVRLGGRLVSSAELSELLADPAGGYVDTITVDEDVHLVLPSGTAVHFGNHSCDPSLWHDGPYRLVSRRRISAGEEVTIDYGTSSGEPTFSMACSCGSVLCRTMVTADDWQRPELVERYGDHWVPALRRRIAER